MKNSIRYEDSTDFNNSEFDLLKFAADRLYNQIMLQIDIDLNNMNYPSKLKE